MVPKTSQDYSDLSKKRKIYWVGDLPPSVLDNCLWKCPKGHVWSASFCGIRRGDGCPECNNIRKSLNKEKYIQIAKDFLISHIDELPQNTKSQTKWFCKDCNHKFRASVSNLRARKYGCPKCKKGNYNPKASKRQKCNKQDYLDLAKSKGIQWAGGHIPQSTHYKTLWQCHKDHCWMSSYQLIRKDRKCPYCAGLNPKTEQDYFDLADSLKYTWIGNKIPNRVAKKTQWKCDNNHVFEASYNYLQQKHFCPICKDFVNGVAVSRPQRILAESLQGELNYIEGKYRVDIKLPSNISKYKIGIEYDCVYWHTDEIKEQLRDSYLVSKNWKIVHIKTYKMMPDACSILMALKQLCLGKDIVRITTPDALQLENK